MVTSLTVPRVQKNVDFPYCGLCRRLVAAEARSLSRLATAIVNDLRCRLLFSQRTPLAFLPREVGIEGLDTFLTSLGRLDAELRSSTPVADSAATDAAWAWLDGSSADTHCLEARQLTLLALVACSSSVAGALARPFLSLFETPEYAVWSTNRPLARVLAWVALRVASSAGKGFCDELLVRGDVVTVICKSNTGRHAVDVREWSVGVPDHLRWLTLPYAPCAVSSRRARMLY